MIDLLISAGSLLWFFITSVVIFLIIGLVIGITFEEYRSFRRKKRKRFRFHIPPWER